jgi:hypothetical protein
LRRSIGTSHADVPTAGVPGQTAADRRQAPISWIIADIIEGVAGVAGNPSHVSPERSVSNLAR